MIIFITLFTIVMGAACIGSVIYGLTLLENKMDKMEERIKKIEQQKDL